MHPYARSLAFGAVAFTASAPASAEPPPGVSFVAYASPTPPMPTSDLSPNGGAVTFGGKRRLATVWALREYLESIRVDDPILYGKLDPELSTLETRKTAALLIGGGGTVAGMVVVAFGIAEASRSGSGVLALVGACTVAVSGLTAFILWPGRGAVRDWVDHHNELKPDRPLDLTLGIAPTPGGGLVAGALTW